MKQLLSKARTRVISHLVLDKGALALVIGLGAFIVLLLIGTQVLDWYWPALIAVVSLGVGVYQLRKNMPSTYEVAQRIDHRLDLADSLSTAFYFSEHPKPGFEAVCAAQYRAAEQLAAGVNLPMALPMPRSRYLLPAGALLLAAAGLFGVRYFMIGSLDLKSSLLEAVADTFFSSSPEEIAANNAKKNPKHGAFDPTKPALPESPEEDKQIPPDFEKGKNMPFGQENKQQSSNGDEKGPGKSDEQSSNETQGDQNLPPQDKQSDQGREGDDKNAAQPQGTDQKSLLDKLRDAVNNVMNKMGSNDQKQNGQKGGEKQKGQQSKDGKAGDEKNSDDSQADNNQSGKDGKQQDNKQSANAPGQKPSQEAASGQGENEGKKAIEEAKMLEAMGKLNELIGERSNQITGDMTVEVGSSQQQLKTELTHQKAGHTDAGGEIHRDQVPLADQLFVEQYFKEVRKSGGAAKMGGAAAKPSVGAPPGSGGGTAKGNGKAAAKSDTKKSQ